MAAIDFPSAPATGDLHPANGRTYIFDGVSWRPATDVLPIPAATDPYVRSYAGFDYWWTGATWQKLAADPSWANVSFMSRMDRMNGSGFIDLSTNAAHAAPLGAGGGGGCGGSGGKFGGASLVSVHNTIGVGAYAPSKVFLGAGNFTAELFFMLTTAGIGVELLDFRSADAITPGPFFLVRNTNVLAYLKTGSAFDITGATTITTNTLHHAHMTRASGVVYLGLDGAQQGGDLADVSDYSTARPMAIGSQVTTTAGRAVGVLCYVRVTKAARYARTYAVPTAPFASY